MLLRLVKRMLERARADCLLPTHPMRVRAMELDDAARRRFETFPPDLASCQYIDYYIRAYAAWHAYTGEDEV